MQNGCHKMVCPGFQEIDRAEGTWQYVGMILRGPEFTLSIGGRQEF